MKRIITTICISAGLALSTFAQNTPIDFETSGNGANWTWTVFENSTNPAVEIIANPDMTGANTSATVMKFTALQAGNPWAGCESQRGTTDLGKFSWDATNRTVKIMVWKPVISDVGIKFISDSGWAEVEVKVANTKVNEWEELTFDFSGKVNPPASQGMLSQIAIFPDFQARAGDNICYVDNVTFNSGTVLPTPTVAAPNPTLNQADVISLFSNVYTNVNVSTWRTGWSNASLEDVQVAGNDVKKYSAMDFVGIETTDANIIDATDMNYINLDVWSPNSTLFKLKLVDFGADGVFGGGDDVEHQLEFTAPAKEEWITYNLKLSDFTGLTTKAHMAQYIIASEPVGSSVVYVDNFYFSKVSAVSGPMAAAPDPTYPAADVISLFSNVYTDVNVSTWRTGWSNAVLEDVQVAGNDVKKYSAMDFVGIETTDANLIDATDMTHINFDIWSPNSTLFKIKLVDFGADGAFQGGDDSEHELEFAAPAKNEWVNYKIPLSDFTGLSAKAHMAQIILASQPTGTSIVYLDNLLFSKASSSINNLSAINQFEVYPNPANDNLTIKMAGNDLQITTYSLVNINGQTVLENTVNANEINTTLNIANLNAGVYFLKVNTNKGMFTNKIIVE